jgi:hypothetical protein
MGLMVVLTWRSTCARGLGGYANDCCLLSALCADRLLSPAPPALEPRGLLNPLLPPPSLPFLAPAAREGCLLMA